MRPSLWVHFVKPSSLYWSWSVIFFSMILSSADGSEANLWYLNWRMVSKPLLISCWESTFILRITACYSTAAQNIWNISHSACQLWPIKSGDVRMEISSNVQKLTSSMSRFLTQLTRCLSSLIWLTALVWLGLAPVDLPDVVFRLWFAVAVLSFPFRSSALWAVARPSRRLVGEERTDQKHLHLHKGTWLTQKHPSWRRVRLEQSCCRISWFTTSEGADKKLNLTQCSFLWGFCAIHSCANVWLSTVGQYVQHHRQCYGL